MYWLQGQYTKAFHSQCLQKKLHLKIVCTFILPLYCLVQNSHISEPNVQYESPYQQSLYECYYVHVNLNGSSEHTPNIRSV